MTHVSYYPIKAWKPGNEAIHVTTSASPAEALYHNSALGMALYGATETLQINAYPAGESGGVIFEGSLPTIDKNRQRLAHLAPEIAQRALSECRMGRESAGGISSLARDIAAVGTPLKERDSFWNRMQHSISPFVQATTWDGCHEYRHKQPWQPPLDSQIHNIIRKANINPDNCALQSIEVPTDMLETLSGIARLDGTTLKAQVIGALQYYNNLRLDDPDLRQKISVRQLLEARRQ